MNWPKVQLQDIALHEKGAIVSGPFGSNISAKYFVEEGVPVIRGNNLTKGITKFIDEGFAYLTEAKAAEFRNCIAVADDIVFTAAGSIGQVGMIPPDSRYEKYVISNKQLRVRLDRSKADPHFVYAWLSSTLMVRYLESMNNGGAVPLLNLGIVRKVPVPLPPIETQSKIAGVLSAYDDLMENNRRRIALLEEAARLLYREWFVHFRFPGHDHVKVTDGLPVGWERRTFNDVCDAVGGGTPKTSKSEYWYDGDIPWYTPTDITRNSCLALLDSATKITEAGLRGSSAKILPAGTVLMTSRASVGFFGIIETPSCTNQGFISVVPHDARARMYLLHNLMHRVEEVRSHAGGATYKEISKGKFKALPIVLPEGMLLREFEEQASTLHAQVRSLHKSNRALVQARDLLLPRLMNGEVAV